MIYSMTGYAHKETKTDWGTAVWKIRSTNQRYLEMNFILPEQFRTIEPVSRDRLRQKITRGKVECHLHCKVNPTKERGLSLNIALAKKVVDATNKLTCMADCFSGINPLQLMQWPGVIETTEESFDAVSKDLLTAFDKSVEEFLGSRGREGQSMKGLIEQYLVAMTSEVKKVRSMMPEILEWQRSRLLSRFGEAKIELDSARLEQEMLLLAQKLDVEEELDRLSYHLKETRNLLQQGGSLGRRLDFIMQELNRESNTLASKSIHNEITKSSVEMKVIIERMREQIQNIE